MEATDSNPNTPNNSNASDLTQATGIRVSFIKSCGEEERTQNKMEVGTESHESKTENLQEGKATKAKKDTGSKQDEEKSKVKRNNKALLVTFLGTSSGLPTVDRNVSSLSIRWPNGKIWLIDCGEGTQKQFLRASGHSFVRISTIFITHNHGDHMYGLIPLLAMFTVTIYLFFYQIFEKSKKKNDSNSYFEAVYTFELLDERSETGYRSNWACWIEEAAGNCV